MARVERVKRTGGTQKDSERREEEGGRGLAWIMIGTFPLLGSVREVCWVAHDPKTYILFLQFFVYLLLDTIFLCFFFFNKFMGG